jgi:hypothetical protein
MKAQTAPYRRTTTMKKTAVALVLLTLLLMTSGAVYAQKPNLKTAPAIPAPDLSKLSIDKILQQLQTTQIQSDTTSEYTSFLQVVAAFLQLTPSQVTELEQLLQARQAKLAPLVQTAQALTQQLGNLLNSGANPAQVGAVVVQIHALQQQAGQVQQAFLSQFAAILAPDQLQRLQAVQIATQLQAILSAFQQIFLF